MLVAVLVTITFFLGRNPVKTIDESDALATCSDAFAANIRSRMNGDDVIITVGGGSTEEFGYTFYVSDNMHLMVEGEFLRSLLLCSVQRYPDGTVLRTRQRSIRKPRWSWAMPSMWMRQRTS